jgi:hypothetical protein
MTVLGCMLSVYLVEFALQVVDEQHGGERYWFTCGKWIGSALEDGGVMSRTLVASKQDPKAGSTKYTVRPSLRIGCKRPATQDVTTQTLYWRNTICIAAEGRHEHRVLQIRPGTAVPVATTPDVSHDT